MGAGIQVLPPTSLILRDWGLLPYLSAHSTSPTKVNMISWKGNLISSMDFRESAAQYPGSVYWDFHRANLHRGLYERALELGAKVKVGMRVVDVEILEKGARVVVEKRRSEEREEKEEKEEEDLTADLVVGADGIFTKLREVMLGREDEPHLTGDLAYRLLLSTKDMLADEELADFVKNPQVNYWMGPDMHAGKHLLLFHLNFAGMPMD